MTFEDLGLSAALLKAVAAEGYSVPTPIQQQAIRHVLDGRDLLGVAQTGTGKTAAFALPILQRLGANQDASKKNQKWLARVLVLSPTRELATQIAASFATYGRHTGLRQTVVYGGVSQYPQAQAIRAGVDIIVATPGRLLDLMNQGLITLGNVETLVIDEADRMFDMGFINDLRKIVSKLPKKRQTLLFSATMPSDIRQLADAVLTDPVQVTIASKNAAADTVEQSVYFVEKRNKPALLTHVIAQAGMTRALVFTRTKHGADKVARHLSRAGIRAEAIHGNKSQGARQRALANFKSHKPPVLVATDVAARGLDIDNVSHVVNFDLPDVPETYVHRIGRTGRAGAAGMAVSFCAAEEREDLRAIEKLLKKKTPVCDDHPQYSAAAAAEAATRPARKSGRPATGGRRKAQSAGAVQTKHRSSRSASVSAKPHTAGSIGVHQPHVPQARAKRAAPVGYTTMW